MIDVSWERMAQLIDAHRDLVYPIFSHNGNETFHDKFQVTPIRLGISFRREKCVKCGNKISKKRGSLKLWRKRSLLCRKCFLRKKQVKT